MNVFAKFDEIPSMLLQDIKETKRYGHTFVRSFGRMDNVKTVYPPTNTVCGGYNKRPYYIELPDFPFWAKVTMKVIPVSVKTSNETPTGISHLSSLKIEFTHENH